MTPYVSLGLAVAMLLAHTPAHAQAADPIADAYNRLYQGQPEAAQERFDSLRRENHEALAPWFGSLFVMMARIDYDETLETRFEQGVDALIDHVARRHASGQDAEALFYLAQAYLLRSTYRLNFDKGMWGAARDAAKSKGYAEDYIRQHPEHGDAYLALGLYNYYVDIAPSLVKVLRVLLFLPSGNRAEGLEQLERARTTGHLFAPFADIAVADIYGSFEGRIEEAVLNLSRLVGRFPVNAELRLELAAMYLHPAVEDYARAEQQYEAVRVAAAGGELPRHVSQRHSAVLGLANVRRNQWRLDEAITLLNHPIASAPPSPQWIMPALLLRRANYKMLLDDPSAMADARRVLGVPAPDGWHNAARRQIAAIESRRRTGEGRVYVALLHGNRLVAEDRFDEAQAAYQAVAKDHPDDWQVRYRLAFLEYARGRYSHAAAGMRVIAEARATMPPWLRAAALLNLAWVRDLSGDRGEAVRLYTRIVDEFEDEPPAAAARLGLIAPYRGRRGG